MNVRFLVFSDLHVDIMHDGAARMEVIARAAREQQVDFVVQLGDAQYPESAFLSAHRPESLELLRRNKPWAMGRDDEKLAVRRLLHELPCPVFSAMGNHDLHVCDKPTVCRYWSMPHPYYSFVSGGVRFIVLDTNLAMSSEGLVDLGMGNNEWLPSDTQRYVDRAQLAWLRETLSASGEPCVLFSHASLVDEVGGIHNPEDVLSALREAGGRVILALNGHSHIDGLTVRQGVPFVNINSASYHWVGADYACVHYSEQLCRMYPKLASTVPYYDPLYAVVEITDSEIRIQGTRSSFVGCSPQEAGLPADETQHPPTARISDRVIPIA